MASAKGLRSPKTLFCYSTINTSLTLFQVEILECGVGEWVPKYRLVALEFDSMRAATMWFDCTPAIKQHDWLGGTDHVAVEINPDKGRECEYLSVYIWISRDTSYCLAKDSICSCCLCTAVYLCKSFVL